MPKVFISYSHDSETHKARVLAFAQALIHHGIVVELDLFHSHRIMDWPRWCRNEMKKADFVLCICTPNYRDRIYGDIPHEEGNGVYWESGLLIKEFYHKKGNDRFLPVLFLPESVDSIPDFMQNGTRCQLTDFNNTDAGFAHLYRILTGQPGATPVPLGSVLTLDKQGHADDPTATSETGTTSNTAKSAADRAGNDGNTKWYWRIGVAALLLVIASLTAWWFWIMPSRELQTAQIDYDNGNLDGARHRLETYPQRWESNAAAQFLLGVIAARQNENRRALEYYENAARLDTSAPQYKGNLAVTRLRIDDSPKSRKEAQKVFADILDGSQPFMLAAVEWLRLELMRDGGPDWPAVDARITTGNRWLRDIPAMNQPWNLNYWRFPDRSGESQRLYFNGDKDHPRDDRQCYWFALTQLARYLHNTGTPLGWPTACTESQPARAILAADIIRIQHTHPQWFNILIDFTNALQI